MNESARQVFFSYAWGGESERIVSKLDAALRARGIVGVYDKRDLDYKGIIRSFMQQIGQGFAIVVVISDKYLRSPNCMFELVEVAKNRDIQGRIFPVVLGDADIYNPVASLKYLKHWEDKLAELSVAMGSMRNQANLQDQQEIANDYDAFRGHISRLIHLLKNMNTLTQDMHENSNFSSLISALEERMDAVVSSPVSAGTPSGAAADQTRVESLLRLIQGTDASKDMLYRLYRRSHPDTRRALDEAPILHWLQDLDDLRSREPNFPAPLTEFAGRLGLELADPEFKQWVTMKSGATSRESSALYEALSAEAKADLLKATLFVEIDADQREVRWCLDTTEPRYRGSVKGEAEIKCDIAADPEGLKSQIAACLRTAMGTVERDLGEKYRKVVSFILPQQLLTSGLELTEVDFDDGLPSRKKTPINKRYPVTLHWDRRATARSDLGNYPINAWRRVLGALSDRMERGVADVAWLEKRGQEDDPDPFLVVAASLLSPKGTAICVGLGYIAQAHCSLSEEVEGCLSQGVPCFFWLATPPRDERKARRTLRDVFRQQRARDAPVSIGELRKTVLSSDPLSSIRIVWDEPRHLPSRVRLTSPE